ncbi:MAG: CPBP family intramembrane metalloprotease, partial [Rhodothermia bacterium]|nr:CPBP family intramembrane metalloprotease [Rhodothermia bacterium]
VAHAPAAFRQGLSMTTVVLYLAQVFVVGLLFAAVYVRTGNLFVAVGLHGLINVPGGLFTSGIDSSFVMLVLTCGVLLVWPYLARLLDEVFTMRPELATSPVGKGHLQFP